MHEGPTPKGEPMVIPNPSARRVVRVAAVAIVLAELGGVGAATPRVLAHRGEDARAGSTIIVPRTPSPTPTAAPTATPSPTLTVAPTAIPSPTPRDVVPPETSIDSVFGSPKDKTITFVFSSPEAGTTFECTFDGTISPCSSPLVVEGLGRRSHTFSVTAIDAAGNRDPSPPEGEVRARRVRSRWRWICSGFFCRRSRVLV